MNASPVIRVEHLTKRYGAARGVEVIAFALGRQAENRNRM
jgi:hypothetical protein